MKLQDFLVPALIAVLIPSIYGCSKKTDSTVLTGLVDVDEIDVASLVPGRIKEMYVKAGDSVAEGQKLVLIESEIVDAKLMQVDEAIKAAEANLALARKGARPEERDVAKDVTKSAQYQVEITKKALDRADALFKRGSIPRTSLDDAQFAHNMALEQLSMAQARESMVKNGTRKEEIEVLVAVLNQARSLKTEVESFRRETVQNSPLKGEIAAVVLRKGEVASIGFPIVTIIDRDECWIAFSIREDMLATMKLGDPVSVEIPALNRKADCKVSFIAPLGDFATWKATTEKDSFDLRSFEVHLKPVERIPELRPGMTARWTVKGR